jgi:hypothetical protein
MAGSMEKEAEGRRSMKISSTNLAKEYHGEDDFSVSGEDLSNRWISLVSRWSGYMIFFGAIMALVGFILHL